MANVDEGAIASAVEERVRKVNDLVGRGQLEQALAAALEDPPDRTKDESVKSKNARAVISVLTSASSAQIPKMVASLSSDDADVAMKHVYKGMELQENTNKLLAWHNALYKKFGQGCIVRAINERRTPVPEKLL